MNDEVEGYMSGLIGKDRPDKDSDIVILTKFIVTPNKAEDFIEVFKKVCSLSPVGCAYSATKVNLSMHRHQHPGLIQGVVLSSRNVQFAFLLMENNPYTSGSGTSSTVVRRYACTQHHKVSPQAWTCYRSKMQL